MQLVGDASNLVKPALYGCHEYARRVGITQYISARKIEKPHGSLHAACGGKRNYLEAAGAAAEDSAAAGADASAAGA